MHAKRYQLDPKGRVPNLSSKSDHPIIYTLVRDDVAEMTGNLHLALLTVCTISHTEASLQSLSRTAQLQASPVPKTMLRTYMSLLRRCRPVVMRRALHFHLHVSKSCYDDTRACFAFADGTRQSSATPESINHSLVISKIDIVVH